MQDLLCLFWEYMDSALRKCVVTSKSNLPVVQTRQDFPKEGKDLSDQECNSSNSILLLLLVNF